MAKTAKRIKKGLVLAGTAFVLLATGCATQGNASDYGTNAACCPTPPPCSTPSCNKCKGYGECKTYADTCDTCDTSAPVYKTKKKHHRKVYATAG